MADYVLPSQRKAKAPARAAAPVPVDSHVLPSQAKGQSKSSIWDELKAIPGDLIRGTVGIPGDIEATASAVRHWYQSKMGMSDAEIAQEQKLENDTTGRAPLPTSQQIISGLQRRGVPLGEHKTKTGQALGTVVSGLPAAVLTGGESALASGAKSVAPSLASWGAGEAAKGTPYQALLATLAGIGTHSAQGAGLGIRQAIKQLPAAHVANAERLAAQVTQEHFPAGQPRADAVAKLAAHTPSPIAKYKPTSSQIIGTPQAARFEKNVSGLAAKPGVEEPVSAQHNAAINAITEPDQYGSIWKKPAFHDDGQPVNPAAPKGDASANLHYHLSKLNDQMADAQDANWAKVESTPNLMHGAPIIDDLKSRIGGLAAQDEQAMRGPIGILKDLDERYGSGTNPSGRGFGDSGVLGLSGGRNYNPMPAAELQSLRSSVLRAGRDTQNTSLSRNLGDLGEALRTHLETPGNYLTDGDRAASDWTAANQSTADYHNLFGSKEPGGAFAAVDKNGNPIKSPYSVIDGITSDPQKYQSLRNNSLLPDPLRSVVDDTVGQAKIADITKNGSTLPTPRQIDAATTSSDFDNFRRVHPDLDARAADLRNASLQKGFADSVVGGPKGIKDFLDEHKQALLDITHPEAHPLIEGVHKAASEVLPPEAPIGSAEPPTPSPTLDSVKLGGNQLLADAHGPALADTIHYGEKAATLGLPLADLLRHGKIGATRLLGEELIGNAADRRFGTPLVNWASNKILGNTREQAISNLAKAQQDPEYFSKLLTSTTDKPNGSSLAQVAAGHALDTAVRIPGWASGQHTPPNEQLPMKQNYPRIEDDDSIPLDAVDTASSGADDSIPLGAVDANATPRAAGGRTGYARGGSVNPHTVERLVNRLIKRVKQAKKETDKTTEPLLRQDDATVAKALAIAKKGI